MASVFDKVMSLLGVREEEDPEEIFDNEDNAEQEDLIPNSRWEKRSHSVTPASRPNLVSFTGGSKVQTKMIILEPREFSEVRSYVDHLKKRSPIIIRLDRMDRQEARRIVDFMSGATYAVDGNMRKLGEEIFFFAPPNVVVEGDLEVDGENLDLRDLP